MSKKRKKMWTMRDGAKIAIEEMTTIHIMNTIALFNEALAHTKFKEKELKWLKEERNKRLGIIKQNEGPVKNRWSILDIRKDEKDESDWF